MAEQIKINENPIVPNGCQDLLVSAKLYFGEQTNTECSGGPITCFLTTSDSSHVLEQLTIFNSEDDEYNEWVNLSVIVSNVTGTTFNLLLNLDGLVSCCEYDIRLDNINIDCFKSEDRIFYDNRKCVGFDLKRVIDNKKSWVYNPGTEDIGKSEDDKLIRDRGSEGLISDFGFIDRKFSPSPDADLPWRYTEYNAQSNVREPHSKSVVNSKEMVLTFNMCTPNYSLLVLEEYKKNFQEFWVRMVEQFVPATTIFVSGEKWCNNDDLICSVFEECDYDYEYVSSTITVTEYETEFIPPNVITSNGGDLTDEVLNNDTINVTNGSETSNSDEGSTATVEGIQVVVIEKELDGFTTVVNSEPYIEPAGTALDEKTSYNDSLRVGETKVIYE